SHADEAELGLRLAGANPDGAALRRRSLRRGYRCREKRVAAIASEEFEQVERRRAEGSMGVEHDSVRIPRARVKDVFEQGSVAGHPDEIGVALEAEKEGRFADGGTQ